MLPYYRHSAGRHDARHSHCEGIASNGGKNDRLARNRRHRRDLRPIRCRRTRKYSELQHLSVSKYATLKDALGEYLDALPRDMRPTRGALAVWRSTEMAKHALRTLDNDQRVKLVAFGLFQITKYQVVGSGI